MVRLRQAVEPLHHPQRRGCGSRPSRVRKNEDFARCASFETRPKWPLLRMRSEISATYLTLRKPEGLSRRVLAQQIRIFPHPVRRIAPWTSRRSSSADPCHYEALTTLAGVEMLPVKNLSVGGASSGEGTIPANSYRPRRHGAAPDCPKVGVSAGRGQRPPRSVARSCMLLQCGPVGRNDQGLGRENTGRRAPRNSLCTDELGNHRRGIGLGHMVSPHPSRWPTAGAAFQPYCAP
jgi:hypothetical protein